MVRIFNGEDSRMKFHKSLMVPVNSSESFILTKNDVTGIQTAEIKKFFHR